jgi:hypothetical protein
VCSFADNNKIFTLKSIQPFLHLIIHLPHPGIPYPAVFQDADSGWIHVLVTLASGLFYRVCFNPYQPNDHFSSCYPLPAPCFMAHSVDLDTLVVATTDARLLQLDCPRETFIGISFLFLCFKMIQSMLLKGIISMNCWNQTFYRLSPLCSRSRMILLHLFNNPLLLLPYASQKA